MIQLTFHRSKREALNHARTIAQKQSVSSVHVQIKLLTDAERARLALVRSKLAAGLSPYEKDANEPTPDNGGLDQERARLANERRLTTREHLSDSRFLDLQAKWSERPTPPHTHTVNVDLRKAFDAILPHPTIQTPDGRTIDDPDIKRCSFCSGFVHRSKATHGKGPLQKKRTMEIQEINDVAILTEKVIHYSSKVIACPACVLEIKPTIDKDGHVSSNIDWNAR